MKRKEKNVHCREIVNRAQILIDESMITDRIILEPFERSLSCTTSTMIHGLAPSHNDQPFNFRFCKAQLDSCRANEYRNSITISVMYRLARLGNAYK